MRIVCPVAWTDLVRRRFACRLKSDIQEHENEFTRYPTFYFPPKVGRRSYGWLMSQSARSAINEIVDLIKPQAVLSYWAHPDGRCAISVAKRLGIPAIVITGGSDVLLLTKERSRRKS